MYLVSACLLGVGCRYDGAVEKRNPVIEALPPGELVPVCPEQLGGLQTPRVPADFADAGKTGDSVWNGDGRVINREGADVTVQYRRGAEEALKLARFFGVKKAYLRRRSPSCGFGTTYSRGEVVEGNGVAAAALAAADIEIIPTGGE